MELLFDSFRRKQTKKETIPYPICSVIADQKTTAYSEDVLSRRFGVFFNEQ
jgi:hypothetical protein